MLGKGLQMRAGGCLRHKLDQFQEEDRFFIKSLSLWAELYPFPVNTLKHSQSVLERGKDAYTGENYLLNVSTVNLFKIHFSAWVQGGVKVMASLSPSLSYRSH